jgi:hypothetical protein
MLTNAYFPAGIFHNAAESQQKPANADKSQHFHGDFP